VKELLEKIHEDMYTKATNYRDEHIKKVNDWAGFMEGVN